MSGDTTFEQIREGAFYSLLQQYQDVVPKKLNALDEQRYSIIPEALNARTGDPHLLKDEVVTLVKWKLSHGKFRPTLQALVQRNEDDTIAELSRDAFNSFSTSKKSPDDAKHALNTLSKLQGIGPATASLLLAVYQPDTVPFFSDQLFRWCLFEDGKGKGWDRDIKYNVKEYVVLYSKVQEFRSKFKKSSGEDISAEEMEKVAYILGKTTAAGVLAVNGSKRKLEAESDQSDAKALDTPLSDSPPEPRKNAAAAPKTSRSRKNTQNTPDSATAASARPKRAKR